MATREVYGSLDSPDTLKVLACLFEHHLDFVFVPIDLDAGEHLKKPFLSMSPFGQVPVLEEGDFHQFESRAIIRSLAHGYGKKLGGQVLVEWDSKKQAIVANWIDVEDHHFEPPALQLLHELGTKVKKGLVPDEKVVGEAEAKLSRVLDIYEARLAKFKFLAGKYTIADLLHLPNLHSLMGISLAKKLIESRPHVNAWCSEILARPAWAQVLAMKEQSQI
ncbi:hypothetical protein UlMin_031257 [Ulmus minor]